MSIVTSKQLNYIETSHLDRSGHIEGDINENHEQKKKSEKQRYLGQNKLLL
jgi:hypothetical protein